MPRSFDPDELDRWIDSIDPASLRDARHQRRIMAAMDGVVSANDELTASVVAARLAGDPWTMIAATLEVSRQAVEKRFGPAVRATQQRIEQQQRSA